MIDRGTPPDSVLQQQAEIAALLEERDPTEPEPKPEPKPVPVRSRNVAMAQAPKTAEPVERVELTFIPGDALANVPGFTLAFDVREVSVGEQFISLDIPSNFEFRPMAMMRFLLTHRETTYPVVFVGAAFSFRIANVRGLSFVREVKP